jgi:hypothetical protein
VTGAGIGALIGLLVGLALSFYVFRLDWRKRRAGARTRPEYRLSLIAVPAILAGLGALVGAAIANL